MAGLVMAAAPPSLANPPVLATETQDSGWGYGWGDNTHGQLGVGVANPQVSPTQLPGIGTDPHLFTAVDVAGGDGFTLFNDKDGNVWGLGRNDVAQLGQGSVGPDQTTMVSIPTFGVANPATMIAAGASMAAALDRQGRVWVWGLVPWSSGYQMSPVQAVFPSGAGNIMDISISPTGSHLLALDDQHHVYAWGEESHGEFGDGALTGTSANPILVSGLPAIGSNTLLRISAGRTWSSLAVSDSTTNVTTLYTWGRGFFYQTGAGDPSDITSPRAVFSHGGKVLSLAAGDTHGLLLLNDGTIWGWGNDGLTTRTTPQAIADPNGAFGNMSSVVAGKNVSFVTRSDGKYAAWGWQSQGDLGLGTSGPNVTVPTLGVVATGETPTSQTPVRLFAGFTTNYAIHQPQVLENTDMPRYFFPAAAVGVAAPDYTGTYTNISTQPLVMNGTSIQGSNPGDFTIVSNTCTGTIALGASCTVVYRFTPAAPGPRSASIVLYTANYLGGIPWSSRLNVQGDGYAPLNGIQNLTLTAPDFPSGPVSSNGPGNIIPLDSIPTSSIPTSLPATQSAPIGRIPIGRIPIGRIPIGRIPIGRIPIGRIPIGRIPIGRIPIGRIPIGRIPIGRIPIGRIPLSQFPLDRQGGWVDFLAPYPALRSVPAEHLTIQDLLNPKEIRSDTTPPADPPLDRLAIGDLAQANGPLANLSLLSILAGGLRLDQFRGVNWCTDLPKLQNGGSCNDGNGLLRPLLELELNGVSMDTTRAAATKVGDLVADSQSGSQSPLAESIFGGIALGSVNLTGTTIGTGIKLSDLPNLNAVVDCSQLAGCADLTKHLGDADVRGAIWNDPATTTATFADLGTALNGFTLANVEETFLDRSSFDWESLPTDRIPLSAYSGQIQQELDFDVNCGQTTGLTVAENLPAGFRFVPGSATLWSTASNAAIPQPDPTVDPVRGVVFSVPATQFTQNVATGPLQCFQSAAHVQLNYSILPANTSGSFTPTADALSSSVPAVTAVAPTINVTPTYDPPFTTPFGQTGAADELIMGHISTPGQVQYIPFNAPVGSQVEVTLSHLAHDYDMVLYYPVGAVSEATLHGAARQVPFGEAPTQDASYAHPETSIAPAALQDIPLLTDRPVAAISATRSTDNEQASLIARSGPSCGSDCAANTRHMIQISGFNGAHGPEDFEVRIRITQPTQLPSCSPRVFPNAAPAAATTPLYQSSGFGTTENTIVLADAQRLAMQYSSAGAQQVMDAAAQLVAGGKGQVLQVDSDPGVRAAYVSYDANPCSPTAANGVVRAINAFVDQQVSGPGVKSRLRYLVIAGDDTIIPLARLEDHTRDGNERDMAGDLLLAGNNSLAGAAGNGFYLSDDPYATFTPQSVLGQVTYLPQVAAGRLVESPTQIVRQINQYLTFKGVADPRTTATNPLAPPSGSRPALITDYDFLASGGTATARSLAGNGFSVDHSLSGVNATWTRQQLEDAWFNHSPVPYVAALNAHYDQYRALPAAGNATGNESDLYSTAHLAANTNQDLLARRIIFSVGCHSGLNVPDELAGSGATSDVIARTYDFAQAYADKGSAVMVGNLGYGYADTQTLAYSAKLMSLFAQGMDGRFTLGTAFAEAKRTYLSQLGGLSAYDLKAMQETVLWGLPMYRLNASTPIDPPAGPVATPTVDSRTGLSSVGLTVGNAAHPLAFTSHTASDGSSYLDAASTDPAVTDHAAHTVATSGRPILPAQFVAVPQVGGLQVHSVVPDGLTSAAATHVTATFAQANVDSAAAGSNPLAGGIFPTTLGHVGTVLDNSGLARTTLVVSAAQFRGDNTGVPGSGAVRTFAASTWKAYYGPVGSVTPPTFGQIDAYALTGATSFSVDVTPAAGRTVKRVYALALPSSGSGAWYHVELLPGSGTRWTGSLNGPMAEYLTVAIDDQGNAAVSTKKGTDYGPEPLPGTISGPVTVTTTPAVPPSGWFHGAAPTANIVGGPGYSLSIDGGAPQPSGTAVTGDGVHLVSLVDPSGNAVPGALVVKIDNAVPVVAIDQSGAGKLYRLNVATPMPASTVVWGASGPGNVQAPAQLPTAAPGLRTATVTATSLAGVAGTDSITYRVIYGAGSHGFVGIAPPPGVSMAITTARCVTAGVCPLNALLPVSFGYSLVDGNGAVVTNATSGNTYSWKSSYCSISSGNPLVQPVIGTATAAPTYNPATKLYTWLLTVPAGPLTLPHGPLFDCEQLTMVMNDGYTTFTANLQPVG
ncbi:MAG: choice-of-anchor D domain-containing protein [Actinomycetota bacterium]|nr:choice-of-anchor D domain-containing protein [Actinomycetota bacterium]